MHLILWEGASWKPVGMSDLLDANAIKKVHRKAALVVHPDKVKDQSPVRQAIAERVYDTLNQAATNWEKQQGRH